MTSTQDGFQLDIRPQTGQITATPDIRLHGSAHCLCGNHTPGPDMASVDQGLWGLAHVPALWPGQRLRGITDTVLSPLVTYAVPTAGSVAIVLG